MWLFPSEILQSVTLDVESIRQHQVFNSFFINHQVKVRSRSGDCKVSHTRWKLKTFKHLKGIPRRTSRGIQGGYQNTFYARQSWFCLWLNRLFIFNHFRCQTFMKQEESLHFNVKHNFFLFVPFPIILLGQLNKSYHFWYYIFSVLTLEESQRERETITCTFYLWARALCINFFAYFSSKNKSV